MERNVDDETESRLSTTKKRPAEQRHHKSLEKPPSTAALDIELKLGWDQGNRQSVALKTFRTDPATFQDYLCSSLLEYEIKSMDRVAPHRNIVRLVDVMVKSPWNVCLVMEAGAVSRGNLVEAIASAPEGR